MMGFGMIGPMSWVVGVLAMVAIWGGVWWALSTFVFHWPTSEHPPAPTTSASTTPATWNQPDFNLGSARTPDATQSADGAPDATPGALPASQTDRRGDYR